MNLSQNEITLEPHPCNCKSPIDRLTQENHTLKLKIIGLESQINTLQTKISSEQQIAETSYKQQISDLEHRLQIANTQISLLNDQIKNNQSTISQSQTTNKLELQDQLDSIITENKNLVNKLQNSQKQIDKDKSYYSNKLSSLNAEISQIYSLLSTYFGSQVDSLSKLNDCVTVSKNQAPKVDNQNDYIAKIKVLQSKNKNLKSVLKEQLKNYETLQNTFQSYHNEMENFKSAALNRDSEYKSEIDDLNSRIDVLTSKITENKEAEIESPKEVPQTIIVEPQQPTSPTNSNDNELEEQLVLKIKKLNCKIIKKNKELQILSQALREKEIKLQDFDVKSETDRLEKEHMESMLNDTQKKLDEANTTIENLKSLKENCEISDITARKLHRQKVVIADQNEEINRLSNQNTKLLDNIKSLNVTVQRLETELSIAKNAIETAKIVQLPPPNVEKSNNSDTSGIQIEWELYDGIPFELQSRIREISCQDSLSLSSKIKMIIETLTKYYNSKIDTMATAKQELIRALKRIEFGLQPFVEEIIYTLTGRKLNFDSIVESPEIQSSAIKVAASKMRSPVEIESLRNQLNSARTEIQELKKKVEKKSKSVVYDSESSIESLRLMKENSELKKLIEEQRESANSKIRDAKFTIINEYEAVISKLKERCAKQKKTIEDLMEQLSNVAN